MQIALALTAFAAAWLLLLAGVDPVPTWFYVFAWYPTLLCLDGVATRRRAGASLLVRPALAASLLSWSAVVWLVFEAANFRLENWYYVFLPASAVERWAGILLSFATVLPAVVLSERTLAAFGVGTRGGGRRVIVSPAALRTSAALGLAAAVLVLAWPRQWFPLVWGVGLVLAEPLVYRRAPALSLFRDLERGDWGRVRRLLLGGLGIGFLWEAYNRAAESGWIYTVPWLERVKLFEMPPFGFLGFPVFALEAWAMYGALCALGVAVPVVGEHRLLTKRTVFAGIAAAGFAVLVLLGMERYTISSTAPRLDDLPGMDRTGTAALRASGLGTVRRLATENPDTVARRAGLGAEAASAAVEAARLVMLRGLGTSHAHTLHALGIGTVCDLAGRDGAELAAAMRAERPGARPTAAEARVWIAAAERTCGRAAAR